VTGRPNPDRAALHTVFRPVRARRVALALAVAQAVVLVAVALAMPGSGYGAFQWQDRLGVVAVAALVAAGLWRLGNVRAVPTETGLTVCNLVAVRTLEWAQIVAVRFGGGPPWLILDLDDGQTLPVMAVQRADGPAGQVQARRLATLVALHSRTDRDD
jgi:hypothetical protein